ncbi:MAG: threonylcarbamoyl-AMP synthase [Geothrix sp.]|uniref:L-threonylcarbamoyladenylate synthase n=1 Tax=Geothrix sp. TaxID=1962974 RepID=UPI0018105A31|nr:L-threonylcarbamoyladenylate synthase [Geothrix sp.]NWJ42526.1 threonylcarbamoyl-AMP synthase [Geothrix sp.]WIL19512.1 MAG: L-threonylcarbamoyladenylate synthase [Geothrix sp.]
MTRILQVAGPDDPAIREAASLLCAGGLVAFPTETVYGLGADGLDPEAVARIYAAKGRPATNPVILHVDGLASARALTSRWPVEATALAERFWPGPLTLVLPASEQVPAIVRAGGPTVALRCPAHPVAQALIKAVGRPLAAPSANRSQHLSPTLAEHVASSLGEAVDLILDGGPTEAGLESTILDLSGARPRILRPGPVAPAELAALLGAVDLWKGAVKLGETQAAPGMAERHYAPRARLELVVPGSGLPANSARTAYVAFGQLPPLPDSIRGILLPLDAEAVGTRLFALLHELDDAGFECVVMERPPEDEAWMAVRDRLRRASAKESV